MKRENVSLSGELSATHVGFSGSKATFRLLASGVFHADWMGVKGGVKGLKPWNLWILRCDGVLLIANSVVSALGFMVECRWPVGFMRGICI